MPSEATDGFGGLFRLDSRPTAPGAARAGSVMTTPPSGNTPLRLRDHCLRRPSADRVDGAGRLALAGLRGSRPPRLRQLRDDPVVRRVDGLADLVVGYRSA